MKIEVVTKRPIQGDLIEFAVKGTKPPAHVSPAEFEGEALASVLVHTATGRVFHIGLGDPKKKPVSDSILRRASGTAVKSLLKIGAEEITISVDKYSAHLEAIVEGAVLAAYKFEVFKMPAARRKNALKRLNLFVDPAAAMKAKTATLNGAILAEATNHVREIGNLPPNVITPITLAERAQKLAKDHGLHCKVWDEKALKRDGFGGIIAVGQGSANPPRFITLEYRGPGVSVKETPYAVVGKAITFDTGGISIKPSDRMDEMKFDKMGGCAVLGIMQAVSELKLPIRLIGLIASAENMPGSRAYRPGDIITTFNGNTIEIINTDAEGRIVLADALSYAVKTYQPRLIFDLATLTGACLVALGTSRGGLFSTDEAIRNQLWKRSEEVGDPVWPLPLDDEYAEIMKSDVALVKNSGGREGGASSAASFLHHWTGETPWVHLDIAGPAWITKELPYLEKGATGFGVRLVADFLRRV